MWRFTKFAKRQPGGVAVIGVALGAAAFMLMVGLIPGALPYPTSALYSDAVITHWPYALYMHRNGFALWYPRIMSGIPFAANPIAKVWYPPQWTVLLLEPTLHLDLMVWLHLALAGAGMWTWARGSGMSVWPAALAAVSYMLAPKTIAHLGAGHLDIVYAMGWFPWLLWAVRRAVADDATRTRAALRFAAIAALLFLADVRVSAFAFVTAGFYALWIIWRARVEAWSHRDFLRSCAVPLLAGGALAVALTAAQWLPLLALSPYLSRGALTAEGAAGFALEPGHLLGLVLGDHAGLHETMTYAGLCVLILAVIGLFAYSRRLAFWAAVIVFAALFALGPSARLWPALVRLFPPLLWWRVPSRAWFVAALALPYLAGWGAHALAEGRRAGARVRLLVVTLVGSVVICGGASVLALTTTLGAETTLAALVASLATAAVILPALAGKLNLRYIAPLLLVIALADLLWIDRTLVEGRGRDDWLDPYEALAEYLVSVDVGRVYTPSNSLPQQAAAYWEINLFGGIDPFQVASYVEMSRRATRIPYDGYAPTIPPYTGEGPVATMWAGITPDAQLMSLWNVTHMVSAFPIEGEGWRLDRRIGDVYVYANTQRVEVGESFDWLPDGATLWVQQDAALVSVPWLPGWRETGLGLVPEQTPEALMRIDVPGVLAYDSQPEKAGLIVSIGALIACLALLWRDRKRSTRPVHDER